MRREPYPILEYDASPTAVIEPRKIIASVDTPEHCVPTFFQEVIERLCSDGRAREIACMHSEMGRHPLYEVAFGGRRLATYLSGVTAPFAGAMLDETIALGCRKFVACGSAGVLDRSIPACQVIVPRSAVRDEGTSYHYIPPSREVSASPEALSALERVLNARGVSYIEGKTWTTDAFYRETPAKVELRRSEGCLTVEMEAAAFFAVAEFRGVPFAQVLYGGDDVSGAEWDDRRWKSRTEVRQALFELAVEACLEL